ncbi:hypothetical protein ACFZBP_38125 [Streptomyces sp. NPDC008086]|uniref:MmyB family transcriptional regulator n=1 Tax=Streptomyces sp. NPDC008086 TaxID=3364807 RepID=UPI0036E39C8B
MGVFSADWTLLSWTPAWAVPLGDPSARTHDERNLVRAVFATGRSGLAAWPVLHDGDALRPALVADLCTALVDYPNDRALTALVEELRSTSAEFARLWDEGAVGPHVSARNRRGEAGVPLGHGRRQRRRPLTSGSRPALHAVTVCRLREHAAV